MAKEMAGGLCGTVSMYNDGRDGSPALDAGVLSLVIRYDPWLAAADGKDATDRSGR